MTQSGPPNPVPAQVLTPLSAHAAANAYGMWIAGREVYAPDARDETPFYAGWQAREAVEAALKLTLEAEIQRLRAALDEVK